MKLSIKQDVLSTLLKKGGLSAFTDDAQGDSTPLAQLIQSVKITANDNITVESVVKTIISKFSIPATTENGIEVKEPGESIVLAKDILSWVNNQSASDISLSLSMLETPEEISDKDSLADKNAVPIKKIGTLNLVSKDNTRTGNKWSLDSYDPSQLPKVKTGNKTEKLFEIDAKTLKQIITLLATSASKTDFQHVYDSVVVQKTKQGIYMGTTDTKRCMLYKLDSVVQNLGSFFESDNAKLLLPIKTVMCFVKMANEDEKVLFEYDQEKHSVLMSQSNFSSRIAIPDKNVFDKFPSLDRLLDKGYSKLCSFNKSTMLNRLVTVSLVNSMTALFSFNEDEVKIHVLSEGGKAPSTSTCSISGLSGTYRVVWGVQHLIDAMKILKDKTITIQVPKEDKNTYKITSEEDPNIMFFAMSPVNPKYDGVKD